MNHNVFRLVLPDRVYGGSSPASRSFVLAALRALHLDPGCGPPPYDTGQNEAKTNENNQDPTFTGVLNTDKEHKPMKTTKITKLALIATATAAATIAIPATANAHVNSGPTPFVSYTFQSPSGNIACEYQQGFDGDETRGYVSCEVRDHTWVAPAATCTGAANDAERAQSGGADGDEFPLIEGESALLSCYWGVGPLSDPHKSTLDYGQTLSVGTITCDSETSGVTCTDSSTGHFFRVSRESYKLG